MFGVTRVGEVALTPLPVPVVVIASSAVPPEFTATTSPPLPVIVGSLSNPASMLFSSDRIALELPEAPLLGYVVWS
jgi:hypothetical protein